MYIHVKILLTIFAALLVVGCDSADKGKTVVARVNGEAIYMAELKTNIISIFGMDKEPSIQDEQRKKILESMVLGRLIKQQAEKDLEQEILDSINRQSKIYKERLIINQYLKNNIKSPEVSDSMIKEYYETHASEYGERKLREYELLTTKDKMSELVRNKMLKDYASLSTGLDISEVYKKLNKKGHHLIYRKDLQDKDLQQSGTRVLVQQLDNKQTSKLSFIDDRPYIVKISSEKLVPATPLSELRSEIAQKQTAVMMKQVIQDKYTELKSQSDIKYFMDK